MTIKYLQLPVEDSHIVVEIQPVAETDLAPGFEMLGVDRASTASQGETENLGAPQAAEHAAAGVTAIATVAFDRIEEAIGLIATSFQRCMEHTEADAGTIAFSITLNAEAGVVVKAGGDASFNVSLTWNRRTEDS